MIPVTKPFLPPREEYQKYIDDIWQRGWLTNNGPLVNELELKLKEYLGVPHTLFLNNGTFALQLAIKALGLKGEIITTPFSYVATVSSIVWEGCEPVFVDIDPETLTIDASRIEAAITSKTSAILATHVYGNPCDIESIERIAQKHNIKVIFDGAHCFGTQFKGKSVFAYGDVTTASFHATKLFHTVEGGAVFTNDPKLLKKMAFMRNFGHNGYEEFAELGVNGKNSEFHAAMGIVNLKYVTDILARRKEISQYYDLKLMPLTHQKIKIHPDTVFNYAYYPIILESEGVLLKAIEQLNANWIHPRRYFHPSLTVLPYIKQQHVPVAEDLARRILCLPLFYELKHEEVDFISRILLRSQNN